MPLKTMGDPIASLLEQEVRTRGRAIFASHAGAAETAQILARLVQQYPHLLQGSIHLCLGHDSFNYQQPNANLYRQYPVLAGVYQSLAFGQGIVHVTLR
jgi:hypothetical protein